MRLFSILKRNSKLALRGSWGRAIIILLIVAGVSTLITAMTQIAITIFADPVVSVNPMTEGLGIAEAIMQEFRLSAAEWIISGIVVILSVLLIAPLSLGEARWYYHLVHSDSRPVTELFYFFETGRSYARSINYEINISIRSLLWMILFYTPPSAVLGVALFFLSGNEELSRAGTLTATAGIFISAALFILATLFYAACICRYTLTPYLIAEDPELTVRKAIKLSVRYTKGLRFRILWFCLSYIGWFLLTVFVFPALYVAPYYSTGIAMYSRFIIEKNRSATPYATQEFTADTGEMPAIAEPEENTEIGIDNIQQDDTNPED